MTIIPIKSAAATTPIAKPKAAAVTLPSVPKKTKMDLSGVKTGVPVKHKAFGDGIVIKLEADKVFVAFGNAEKAFLYPSAFENGFLSVGE